MQHQIRTGEAKRGKQGKAEVGGERRNQIKSTRNCLYWALNGFGPGISKLIATIDVGIIPPTSKAGGRTSAVGGGRGGKFLK